MQAIKQADIKADEAALMAVKDARNPVNVARSVEVMPRKGCQALKQPAFEWKAAEKCQELQTLR